MACCPVPPRYIRDDYVWNSWPEPPDVFTVLYLSLRQRLLMSDPDWQPMISIFTPKLTPRREWELVVVVERRSALFDFFEQSGAAQWCRQLNNTETVRMRHC